jgi:RecA/RadA recombinase
MSKLADKILKNSPTKYATILSESTFFNNKDIIPMDIPIFNIGFSGELDGGMVSGLTLVAGPSKTFKTNIALVCVRAYLNQYKDAVCVLYDSEGGITPEYLKSQGVDPSRVVHIPIEHLEMLKFDIVKQLKELDRGDKVIFVIDSIGNTASLKELQDALDEKTVAEMQRAKVIKGLFRMVTASLVNKDIPCIAVCHTYETMEMYSKAVISGGTGLIYSANQAFIIGKSQEKVGNELIGWNFTLNVEKSRFVREKSKFAFRVLYNSGIQKYSGLLELATEAGLIHKPSMGWYSRVDEDGVIEDKKWRAKDTDSDIFWTNMLKSEKFKEYIRNKYKLITNNPIIDEDESILLKAPEDEDEHDSGRPPKI